MGSRRPTSDLSSAATVVRMESVSSSILMTLSVGTWITGLSGIFNVYNLVRSEHCPFVGCASAVYV